MGLEASLVRPGTPSALRRHFANIAGAVGLLLMGAGACTGVFCGLAFHEASRHPQQAVSSQVPSPVPGQPPLVVSQNVRNLRPLVVAYELLATSLGLFLGGLSVLLLGGVVSRYPAPPAGSTPAPDALRSQ
jgi:hypothetical protein